MSEQLQDASQGSLPWWVRFCRWLKATLLYVWGTLIGGILVSTLANLNTTTTDTPFSKLYVVHLALIFPIPVFASLGFLFLLTLLSLVGSRERDATMPPTLSEQNRTHMLRRLHLRYEQMMAQSLQGAVQLELGLASRPAAVQNAASLSLRLPDQSEQLLPPHTSIVDAYNQAQQELLILGEPGAGKSALLLELAHHLVEQAKRDDAQALPVLLPLSSWATNQGPLQDWLIEQVAVLYDVPRKLSQQWVQVDLILPLLDGLDEMNEPARAACIVAINAYHREHLRPLVVCSRTNEYTAAAKQERLALHTAVVVQPLSMEQVDTYLKGLGKPLAALRSALKKHTTLQEVATTPLMLQVLMLTYHGTLVLGLSHKETQLRQQIWTDYVQRMVKRKGDAKRYPFQVTTAWLGWLARQMQAHNQTIFFLEQLQPNWLPKRRRAIYQWNIGLLFVLLFVLPSVLLFGLTNGLLSVLFFGLTNGLIIGLFSGLDMTIKPAEALIWSWKGQKGGLLKGLFSGLFVGLFSGLFVGLLKGLLNGLLAGLAAGLFAGLVFGLPFWLSGAQLTDRRILSPNEGIHRSMKNGLFAGLVFGLLLGLLFGSLTGLTNGLLFGLTNGLLFGLYLGSLTGLVFGLGAVLRHALLRFWLWRSHLFPLDAVPFLEDATARILLRRVDGGYSFTHRLLLDYFADLETIPPVPSTNVHPAQQLSSL